MLSWFLNLVPVLLLQIALVSRQVIPTDGSTLLHAVTLKTLCCTATSERECLVRRGKESGPADRSLKVAFQNM